MERLNYAAINVAAVASLAKAKKDVTLIQDRWRAMIELRVSQINGCAYCVDLHSQEARAAGEDQQRLDCLTVWREVAFFTPAEKASLAWAESVTQVSGQGVPDTIFTELQSHYSDAEIVDLTMIVAQMNAWNRLAISLGSPQVTRR